LSSTDLNPLTYLIPAQELRLENTVANSRFIATINPAGNIDEARAFIAGIRKDFADASHNVPAFIIGGGNTVSEYCSDDGEPSGTAGRPVLAVLRGSGLGDVALVITRYFGGTLLGKGGLVKAYTESAQLVVNTVSRAQKSRFHEISIVLPYNLLEPIRLLVKKYHGDIQGEDFSVDIKMLLSIPVDDFSGFQNRLRELSSGKLKAEIISTKEILVPVIGK
jgi:uncharacterized YigZ family protein